MNAARRTFQPPHPSTPDSCLLSPDSCLLSPISFLDFIGHKQAKLSLILNLIDPGIGGVLFVGEKGTGKSTLARSAASLLPRGAAFVDVPLNVTEEMLLGCVNIEEAVRTGNRIIERGLIGRAQDGVLYVDDVNLLQADALNLILNTQDRAGMSLDKALWSTETVPDESDFVISNGAVVHVPAGHPKTHEKALSAFNPQLATHTPILFEAERREKSVSPAVPGQKDFSPSARNDTFCRLSECSPSFILIGTMNPEEGFISAHAVDRFGLCCKFETTTDKDCRLRIARRATSGGWGEEHCRSREARLRSSIDRARRLLPSIRISDKIRDEIVTACLSANVAGHRADLVLQRSAKAYAAFCGASEVAERHLAKVIPMVLMHRMRTVQNAPQEGKKEQQVQEHNPTQDDPDDMDSGENRNVHERPENEDRSPPEKNGPGPPEPQHPNRSGRSDEEIFTVGDPFKVRRIVFGKDRKERRASGRRTQTKFAGKGGRYVKSTLRPREHDIAVDATLRAAAPWQRLRGRNRRMIIHDDDFRYKERERKMGHVVIFAVDCSGSMGAKRRMIETKGAILSLLTDCYHKRDKVAMIAFRKDRAELLLPPTSSAELASARLRELPVGGKTPLGAGLLETYNLIRRVANKDPHTRFVVVVISDGRANQGMTDLPVKEEVARCAGMLLELKHTDYLVVDTEDKSGFMHADLAAALASLLRADYFTTTDLKAEYLTQIVSGRWE